MNGRIIFLNGPSSAGKTTLARALRTRLPPEFCYFASDQLAEAGFRPIDQVSSDLSRDRFFDGFHRSIAAFASAGNDLLVEHIVEERAWADDLRLMLASFDVFWVGVFAPAIELSRRELARGDRALGEALCHLKTSLLLRVRHRHRDRLDPAYRRKRRCALEGVGKAQMNWQRSRALLLGVAKMGNHDAI